MKNIKIFIASVMLLCSAVLLTACGQEDMPGTESTVSQETTAASEEETSEETTAEEETTSAETTAAETTSTASSSKTTKTTASTTASSAETTTKTTSTAAAQTVSQDFSGISGYWYIDGDPFAASLYISGDGKFTAYYASGSEETSGYVRKELNSVLNNYLYVLYLDDDTEYTFFADDGESDKTDIYMGSQGSPHYVKLYGEGGLGDDGRGIGDEFAGTWYCGRAYLTIDDMGEGIFHANIQWSDSAWAYVKWDYPLIFVDGQLVCEGNGTKSYIEYKDENSEPDVTVEYTDGSAVFELSGDGIAWIDQNENSGNGMIFLNTPVQ